MPEWLMDRLKHDLTLTPTAINYAHRLHFELKSKFIDYRTGIGTPKRETLAAAMGVHPKTVSRAIEALRRAGGLRTVLRHDPLGHVLGLEFTVLTDPPEEGDAPAKRTPVSTGAAPQIDDTKRTALSTGPNLKESAKRTPVSTGQSPKTAQNTKESAKRTRVSTWTPSAAKRTPESTQYLDHVDQDLRGAAAAQDLARATHGDNASHPAPQQQHALPKTDNPTVPEIVCAFYALADSLDGLPYGRRKSDPGTAFRLQGMAAAAGESIFDVFTAWFKWPHRFFTDNPQQERAMGLLRLHFSDVVRAMRAERRPRIVSPPGPHPADTDAILTNPEKRAAVERQLRQTRH